MSSATKATAKPEDPGFSPRHGVNWSDYALYRPKYPASFFNRIYEYHAGKPRASWETAHDVGAGYGIVSSTHVERFDRVIVSDPNEGYNEIARQFLVEKCGKPESKFVFLQEGGEESSVEAGTVDLITACECMHWMDTVRAVDEFARQLKPGGTLVMTFYTLPVILDNERAQPIWAEIMKALTKKVDEPLVDRAYRIVNGGLDSIALPPERWAAIKRVYINARPGIFKLGDCVDESRVGSNEELVWVHGDCDWSYEQGLDWLKKLVTTLPGDFPESKAQDLWDWLEHAANGAKFRLEVPVMMVFATKRAD